MATQTPLSKKSTNVSSQQNEDQTPITFLKLPFQSNSAASKIKQALHRHGLSSTIRLVFQHFKSRHPMHPLKWKWKIVCKIKDWYARTATETIITHKHNLTSQKVRDLNYAIMYNNN